MIVVTLIILPSKFDNLITLWIERKNTTSYTGANLIKIEHIVVCLTHLNADFVLHFLKEFYAHRKNQVYYYPYFYLKNITIYNANISFKSINSVFLSTSDLTSQMKRILHSPMWHGRVVYICGSALRNGDLLRAK